MSDGTEARPGEPEVDADEDRLADARQARQLRQYPRPCGAARAAATARGARAAAAARAGDPLRQAFRLHRRRRHPRVHDASAPRPTALDTIDARPAHLRAARGAALSDRRRHSRLCARRRARARARLPLSRRASAIRGWRWDCRRCSSASIRASAARCAPCGCSVCAPAMNLMLTGRPVRADQALRLGLVDRLVATSATNSMRPRARSLRAAPPPHRAAAARAAAELAGRAARCCARRCCGRSRTQARREHYPAPYAIVELWARYGARGAAAYERGGALDSRRCFDSDTRAQPDPRVPAAGSTQGAGRQERGADRARARDRRRRHGRGHRRLVRAARP